MTWDQSGHGYWNDTNISGTVVKNMPEPTTLINTETMRMVAFGEYVQDGTGGAMKSRDYKDATDLIIQKSPQP